MQGYRFDRVGEVVADTRRYTPAYFDPEGHKYRRGDALRVPGRSSPARLRYRAARRARRALVRAA